MIPLVYQVVLSEIKADIIKKCLNSVKLYADRMGYDYEYDTNWPEWAKGMLPGTACEWMRIDKMTSRPKVMYVDWDIEILQDFELKDDIITIDTCDSLMYYGQHVELAKQVKKEMGERIIYTQEEYNQGHYGMGHFAFKKIYGDFSKHLLDRSKYIHLHYHLTSCRWDKSLRNKCYNFYGFNF